MVVQRGLNHLSKLKISQKIDLEYKTLKFNLKAMKYTLLFLILFIMPPISFAQRNDNENEKTVAIPASDKSNDAVMDQVFSKCSYFCFYNTKTVKTTFKENPYKASSGGASKLVIQFLVENKANEVYAVQLGQNAKMHLDRYKIPVNIVDSGKTINQIISIIKNK